MSVMIICIVEKFKDWHHLTSNKQKKQHVALICKLSNDNNAEELPHQLKHVYTLAIKLTF